MDKNIKIVFIVFISVFIGVLIGYYIAFNKVEREEKTTCLNSMLYNLNIEMDLLEHWKAFYQNDSVMEEDIKHLILNKLISLSMSNTRIENLKGVPLEALYRLINFNEKHNIQLEKQKKVFKKYLDYLSSIEKEIIQTSKKRKRLQIESLKQLNKQE